MVLYYWRHILFIATCVLGILRKVTLPRVAPVTGTPRTLGQLHIDPAPLTQGDPSPSQSNTSSESSSPVPPSSQNRRKQKVIFVHKYMHSLST